MKISSSYRASGGRGSVLSFLLCALLCIGAASCRKDDPYEIKKPDSGQETAQEEYTRKTGHEYVFGSAAYSDGLLASGEGGSASVDGAFCDGIIPSVRVSVSRDDWQELLDSYDQSSETTLQIPVTISFEKGYEKTVVDSCGFRLKGNTSRRRPQDGDASSDGDFNHFHFQINTRKFIDDKSHTIHGLRKLHFKWFKDDPSYCREIFCYDLFRRCGIWTAARDVYARVFLTVEGRDEAYLGVYEIIEPYDGSYLKVREDRFEAEAAQDGATIKAVDGFLWKCRYGADLCSTPTSMSKDGDSGKPVYELKTSTESFTTARNQLRSFTSNVRSLSGEAFRSWIEDVCDVKLLLRTYAVSVAVGMWDDYWVNKNNFYIYFDSRNTISYRFYFIPYDYDNTLGTSLSIGSFYDSGRQDPLSWGDSSSNPLIYKILQNDDWKAYYIECLKEIVSEASLMQPSGSMQRIKVWQQKISTFVDNDTGEDCSIEDKPASWGNHPEYRLTSGSRENFFLVKKGVVDAL